MTLQRAGLAALMCLALVPALHAQSPVPSNAVLLAKIAALEQEIATLKAQLRPAPIATQLPITYSPTLAEASSEAAKMKHDWPLSTNTYTNADLKDGPPVIAPPPISAVPAPSERDVYQQIAKRDEAYWKGRMQNLQSALDTDAIHLVAMAERVASLTADFNSSPSLSQRVVLRRELEAAETEATRLRAMVSADRRAIATAEEEARRANVPPGWLRP